MTAFMRLSDISIAQAFKFDIEDMTNKVYERYPTLRKRAMNGEKVVFAF